jgi:hypothetical protein
MPYNLTSPNSIAAPCDMSDLDGWLARELQLLPNEAERTVMQVFTAQVDSFVHWASEARLLWPGCDRVPPVGRRQKYFTYPPHIKAMAKACGLQLDTRANGPAIAAFVIGGGTRPSRFGSSNAWSIHHLYSGKFPYLGRSTTTHAAKEPNHFTQSAGLIAAHPLADALADEFPFFAWYLRAQAYLRFGYDPDGVFANTRDDLGFAKGRACRVGEVANHVTEIR